MISYTSCGQCLRDGLPLEDALSMYIIIIIIIIIIIKGEGLLREVMEDRNHEAEK